MTGESVKYYFRQLLNAYWLRPESAVWYAHMLGMADRFLGKDYLSPSLEFGCMDGVNAFVLLGGQFEPAFDVYKEVKWQPDSHKRATLKDDYFDTVSESRPKLEISRAVARQFDYGVGWKDAHLAKAARLGAYQEVIELDLENASIGLGDESVSTMWAPNIYWMENLPRVMAELRRILKRDGRIVTIGPDLNLLNTMLYRFADSADESWLQTLDRGRFENASRHARDLAEWKQVFGAAGLRVTRSEMFIPPILGQIYDVGLRPMFPVFMNMYEKLSRGAPEDLADLKSHWVESIEHFLGPLCEPEWMTQLNDRMAWHIFELAPNDAAAA